jgi:hypothetical protein
MPPGGMCETGLTRARSVGHALSWAMPMVSADTPSFRESITGQPSTRQHGLKRVVNIESEHQTVPFRAESLIGTGHRARRMGESRRLPDMA